MLKEAGAVCVADANPFSGITLAIAPPLSAMFLIKERLFVLISGSFLMMRLKDKEIRDSANSSS
jgi:hypothetical protein